MPWHEPEFCCEKTFSIVPSSLYKKLSMPSHILSLITLQVSKENKRKPYLLPSAPCYHVTAGNSKEEHHKPETQTESHRERKQKEEVSQPWVLLRKLSFFSSINKKTRALTKMLRES